MGYPACPAPPLPPINPMKSKSSVGSVLLLVVLAGAWMLKEHYWPSTASSEATRSSQTAATDAGDGGAAVIARAFAAQRSDLIVTVRATVSRILADDDHPPRHQRFIIRMSDGKTVLIAHNTDLAPRVPLEKGDTVEIHGEYEWNDRGGVLHWTHHDPRGRHEGGWIKHRGKKYE